MRRTRVYRPAIMSAVLIISFIMFAAMQAHTALAKTTLDVTVRVMCLSEDENGNLLDESQARGWGEITVHVTNKDTGEHYETVSDYDGNAAFSLPEGTYTWYCSSVRYGYYTYRTADGREEMIMNSDMDEGDRKIWISASSDGSLYAEGDGVFYIAFPSLDYLNEHPDTWNIIDDAGRTGYNTGTGGWWGLEPSEEPLWSDDAEDLMTMLVPLAIFLIIAAVTTAAKKQLKGGGAGRKSTRSGAQEANPGSGESDTPWWGLPGRGAENDTFAACSSEPAKSAVTGQRCTPAKRPELCRRKDMHGENDDKYVDTRGYRGTFDVDGHRQDYKGFDR